MSILYHSRPEVLSHIIHEKRMSKKLIMILAFCLFAASGCNIIYKQNIQQGNAIEQDKLDQLKLGMTMNQVAFLLGTPAVRDPFHQERWDYYYSFSIRGGDPLTRLVTLRFENAILTEMSGTDFDNPDSVITAGDEPALTESPVIEEQATVEPAISAIETPVSEDITVAEVPEVTAEVQDTVPEISVPESAAPETAVVVSVPVAEESPAEWVIQIGAFESLQNAESLVARMEQEGFAANITHQQVAHLGTRYLVRTEGFDSKEQAQQQLEMINTTLEIDAFLIPPSSQ